MANPNRTSGAIRSLLSTEEVARILNVSPKTIYRAIESGDLRANRIGRQWRIAEEELNRFIDSRPSWRRVFVS
ncbi:helix-turn-helix domain-containing protein [uncultured Albimonas sp.]|uniref:helix-turn-helix domain-containing protein n=1 Tax=uncultured Albimonas sp. TaxID=1331701 RepID=UPI0030EC947E|tara:strand:+ start:721 stop:939 length:219 start_codon:yes stop_codon:yes gene_type:complete